MDQPYRTHAVVVPLDPTPAQAQMLRSYCGSSRFAYNWAIARVKENLDVRSHERADGIAEPNLTKSLNWSPFTLTPLWNAMKDEVAPWHRDVTKHAFRSGVAAAGHDAKAVKGVLARRLLQEGIGILESFVWQQWRVSHAQECVTIVGP